jgi:hypothetical protein
MLPDRVPIPKAMCQKLGVSLVFVSLLEQQCITKISSKRDGTWGFIDCVEMPNFFPFGHFAKQTSPKFRAIKRERSAVIRPWRDPSQTFLLPKNLACVTILATLPNEGLRDVYCFFSRCQDLRTPFWVECCQGCSVEQAAGHRDGP